MNRTSYRRRITVTVAGVMTAALVASCSSDAKKLSSGGFADEMNEICRDATRGLRDLDESDPQAYFADLVDIVEAAFDDLDALEPASNDEDDFEDFTGNLDDQASAAKQISEAVDDEDFEVAAEEYAAFLELNADNDDLADSLGADRCVGMFDDVIVPIEDVPATTPTPPSSDPGTTEAPETTEDTTPVATADTTPDTTDAPPITDPPATTAPPTTAPMTAPPETSPMQTVPPMSGSESENLADFYNPPLGYEWNVEVSETFTAVFLAPTDDPVIGPVLVGYGVGAALPAGGPGPAIIARIATINAPFTTDQAVALLGYEGLTAGVDVTTPSGFSAILQTAEASGQTFDLIIAFFGPDAVMVQQESGADPAVSLDAFINANLAG